MPVTKTAKRALRSSKKKEVVNQQIRANLEAAIRVARKKRGEKNILTAISLADRTAKKNIIHKNKAARIKSSLSKLLPHRTKASSAERSQARSGHSRPEAKTKNKS